MRRQHGVISRGQLLALGFSRDAITHRLGVGQLHQVRRGVYAVGRPELTRRGWWMAVVLACGPRAVLSHSSAAALWGLGGEGDQPEVTVPRAAGCRVSGVGVHRRDLRPEEAETRFGIPVTSAACTLIDMASRVSEGRLETAINEADKLDLIHPEELRAAADRTPRRAGCAAVRHVLDVRTFTLTDSELERRFLRLIGAAGLPQPLTRRTVNGFRVDFWWPELGLVVETDGLRYHRTPSQQARDIARDNVHMAAGLTPLRFTHNQVTNDRAHVVRTLELVARRLRAN